MNKKIILVSSVLLLTFSLSACKNFGRDHGRHHRFHEKWFSEIDANNDGFITKEEMNKYSAKKFDEMDIDKDGKICKKELKEYKHKKDK